MVAFSRNWSVVNLITEFLQSSYKLSITKFSTIITLKNGE